MEFWIKSIKDDTKFIWTKIAQPHGQNRTCNASAKHHSDGVCKHVQIFIFLVSYLIGCQCLHYGDIRVEVSDFFSEFSGNFNPDFQHLGSVKMIVAAFQQHDRNEKLQARKSVVKNERDICDGSGLNTIENSKDSHP